MDLGATICTPKKPGLRAVPMERCLRRARARRAGDLPAQGGQDRAASCAAARPSWSCARMARVLVRHAAGPSGLLGGMTEVPTTEWTHDFDRDGALDAAAAQADWRRVPGVVTHVFTHFPLELTVYVARAGQRRKRRPACASWRRAISTAKRSPTSCARS